MTQSRSVPAETALVSAAAMIARIDADASCPPAKRAELKWAIAAACRWAQREPEAMPFTAMAMRETLARISSGKAGVARKTVQNARSAVEHVLRHYAGSTADSCFAHPLSEECVHWWTRLDKYQRASLTKLFRFISGQGLALRDVDEAVGARFRAALDAELPAEQTRVICQAALLAWNKLAANSAAWPGRPLVRPGDERTRALRWSQLPESLAEAVEALFAARNADCSLFEREDRRRLRPSTIRNRKEHLRIAASLLCQQHGVAPSTITGLGDLCRPDRFKLVIETLVKRYNGAVTAYVEQVGVTLLQAAEEGNCLSPEDVEQVRALKRRVYRQRQHDQKSEVNSDQAILNELDDEAAMGRLLSLPDRIATRVIRRGVRDERAALDFQLATAVSLLLAAPLRIANFAALDLDANIGRVTKGDSTRFIIRVPGEMTKNGRPIELVLDDEPARLLATYLSDYRPILAAPDCRWLWPGNKGSHKHPQVLARQLAAFVREGAGIRFHPHLMRKVATKIILDDNPGAIEVARLLLGHSDTRPTRSAYVQSQIRSAQTEYTKALVSRRLGALTALGASRAAAPAPLKVGKGRRARAGGEL